MQATLTDVDPFDLPEWLGTREVVWRPDAGLDVGPLVRGRLSADTRAPGSEPDASPDEGTDEMACDLLAVDEAYPEPVTDDATRLAVHQAWRHGQVVVGDVGGRLVLAVPGTGFDAERVLDVLGRLARAVGARPERYAALLRLTR